MKLIDDLRSCSSLQQELAVLQGGLSPIELRTLMYTYDYTKNYSDLMHIKQPSGYNIGNPNEAMFGILDDILDGTIRGKRAWSAVFAHARLYGELIKMIVNKSLVSGVGEILIHSAFTNLIPKYDIQSIVDYTELREVYYPVLCEPILEGKRVTIRCTYDSIVIRDEYRDIVRMKELEAELATHPLSPCVLDCIVIEDGTCLAIDYLSLVEFDTSKCLTRLRTRKGLLRVCIKGLRLIKPIPYTIVSLEEDLLRMDSTSTVLKDPSGVYLDNSWSRLA